MQDEFLKLNQKKWGINLKLGWGIKLKLDNITESQARKQEAVTRTTPFCLWLNSFIKLWFIMERNCGRVDLPEPDVWYRSKSTISFQDMLAALRRSFWLNLFSCMSTCEDDFEKFNLYAINSLSNVA